MYRSSLHFTLAPSLEVKIPRGKLYVMVALKGPVPYVRLSITLVDLWVNT